MRITYLGHAGFCVETDEMVLIMDPWLSAEGAFDSAWFQFPRNHHLARFVQTKLEDRTRERFIYISHIHGDHFDKPFLSRAATAQATFVIPQFRQPAFQEAISMFPSRNVVVCHDEEDFIVPGGSLTMLVDDHEFNRDSALLLRIDGHSMLNLNDCKIHDRAANIEGVDVFTCQFSGATWHPTCYDYPPERYEQIAQQKMTQKFEAVARTIEALQPSFFLPAAGPPCFLDPSLAHINFEPVNIFPRATEFLDFFAERHGSSKVKCVALDPGDSLDAAAGMVKRVGSGERRVEFREAVRSYAADYADFFAEFTARHAGAHADDIYERLAAELQRKLDNFPLRHRVEIPLYLSGRETDSPLVRVDFSRGVVGLTNDISETAYYSVAVPEWELQRVLDGAITWEELSLTFRVVLHRTPDVYQPHIHAFLVLQAEDLTPYCDRFQDEEARQERIVVTAGGRSYEVDRYCRHQGGDLSLGTILDGRYLVCPRHGWRYDLQDGGRCTTADATISAVPSRSP